MLQFLWSIGHLLLVEKHRNKFHVAAPDEDNPKGKAKAGIAIPGSQLVTLFFLPDFRCHSSAVRAGTIPWFLTQVDGVLGIFNANADHADIVDEREIKIAQVTQNLVVGF